MCELESVKSACEKSSTLESTLDKLGKEMEQLEKREQCYLLELQRLRHCESELNAAVEKNKLKEDKILELLRQNSELDGLRASANDQIKKMRTEFEENVELLTGENAVLLCEKHSMQAQLMALREGSLMDEKNANDEVIKRIVVNFIVGCPNLEKKLNILIFLSQINCICVYHIKSCEIRLKSHCN